MRDIKRGALTIIVVATAISIAIETGMAEIIIIAIEKMLNIATKFVVAFIAALTFAIKTE